LKRAIGNLNWSSKTAIGASQQRCLPARALHGRRYLQLFQSSLACRHLRTPIYVNPAHKRPNHGASSLLYRSPHSTLYLAAASPAFGECKARIRRSPLIRTLPHSVLQSTETKATSTVPTGAYTSKDGAWLTATKGQHGAMAPAPASPGGENGIC